MGSGGSGRGCKLIGRIKSQSEAQKFKLFDLLQPHFRALGLGIIAVTGEGVANLLEPWPLKIVLGIASLGAVSSYTEKRITTSVGQWVMHDLRRTLYSHMQRLSLAYHDHT